jgi:hypothetical protein
VGVNVGTVVLGARVGLSDKRAVGSKEGDADGRPVDGMAVGVATGSRLGAAVGAATGTGLGSTVESTAGAAVGATVTGLVVGVNVGAPAVAEGANVVTLVEGAAVAVGSIVFTSNWP